MSRTYNYAGQVTIPLNGASQGIYDLGANPWGKIIPQVDLATNAGYKVYLQPCKGDSTAVFSTASLTKFASDQDGAGFDQTGLSADHLEVLSSSNLDIGKVLSIYGVEDTKFTVKKIDVVLQGTTAVDVYFDYPLATLNFDLVLGLELSAAAVGTITVREASGNATVGQIAAAATSAGVYDVPAARHGAYGLPVLLDCEGASTAYVGVWGETSSSGDTGEAIALTGTTALYTTTNFTRVKKLLVGDVEAAANQVSAGLYGIVNAGTLELTDKGADEIVMGHRQRYLLWSCYNGTTLTAAGANDRIDVALYG